MEKGEFFITLDDDRHVVLVLVKGDVKPDLGDQIVIAARTAAAEHGYDIFYDLREARVFATFSDWFYLPRRLSVLKDLPTRRAWAAVLISPGKHEPSYRFLETVMRNLGLRFRVFLEEQQAFEWLKESATA